MKIKLHNKFEITKNGESIVAYNTLLKGVFTKISNLEEYTSRIAIGTGTTEVGFTDSKMSNFTNSFSTETEDICADISKPQLYIKKLVSFDESDETSFSFCELGLCCSSETNPDIYNHVLLKNQSGEIVTITKNAGDVLQIRITVYLELESATEMYFYKGENPLIKQILGENLNVSDRHLYVVRGEDLSDNNPNNTHAPVTLDTSATQCRMNVSEQDQTITITFTAKLGEGITEEILVVYDDQICLRQNILDLLPATTITQTLQNSTDGVITLGKYIKSVDSVKHNGEELINQVYIRKYGDKIIYKNKNPLDTNFSASAKVFVSEDQKYIAFIENNTAYMYGYKHNEFYRLNIMLPQNMLHMSIFSNKIICVLKESPFIRIYDFANDKITERTVSLSNFNVTSLPTNWVKSAIIRISEDQFIVGLISDQASNSISFAIKLSKNSNNIYTDEVIRTVLGQADTLLAIPKTAFIENSMLMFITSTYEGSLLYGAEVIDHTGVANIVSSGEIAYAMLENHQTLQNAGRMVVKAGTDNKTSIIYLPEYEEASIKLPTANYAYSSSDGTYTIFLSTDGTKIYHSFNKNQLTELPTSYQTILEQTGYNNYIFMDNILFARNSNDPLKTICYIIKNEYTRIDDVKYDSVDVTYTKYNVLGADPDQGVQVELIFAFNCQQTTEGE